ncbi:MAG: hypothetical protein NC338_08665 [Firmicutes bacterium]|nr:hypothetical protein [Bacillota bacterium]
MRKAPSWTDFKYKFNSEAEQRDRFEDLSRCLFCESFGLKNGIFQYINQAGIECDPITRGEKVIGFQSKYFKNKINTKEINDSLDKIPSKYPSVNTVYLYCNLTFGQSTKAGKIKPAAQLEVENHAAKLGLEIEWITDKMILDQAARYEWIYDLFFNNGQSLEELVRTEIEHTKSYFKTINNSIKFADKTIKVSHTDFVENIANTIGPHSHFIIHGNGGTGKTAIVKDLVEYMGTIPVCVRKAQAMDSSKTSDSLNLENGFTMHHFLKAYETCSQKIFIIDSAERIKEMENVDVLMSLIRELDENGWSIIFTSRNIYLDDLQELFERHCATPPKLIALDEISNEQLTNLSADFNFHLPEESAFKDCLRNPLYLSLYLKSYSKVDRTGSYGNFLKLIHKEIIEGTSTKNGIGFQRDECFMKLVRQRLDTGNYYLDGTGLNTTALQALIEAGVLKLENNSLIVFAHDIFEEWGVERVIHSAWNRKRNYVEFTNDVGNSFIARRIFRKWISNVAHEDISRMMQCALADDTSISSLWKDEMLVAVLNSDQSLQILENNKHILLENNERALKRLAALLRLSCKRFSGTVNLRGNSYPRYVPFGEGWENLIQFIYNQKDNISHLSYYLEILNEFSYSAKSGETLRQCGLLVLDILLRCNAKDRMYIDATTETRICEILCLSSEEIKNEIESLLDSIIANKWVHHNDPYFFFSEYILHNKGWCVMRLCKVATQKVLNLAELFWKSHEDNDVNTLFQSYERESEWGLSNFATSFEYNCSWPFSTPIPYLLRYGCAKTLKFLTDFINEVILNNTHGIPNHDLWNIYRGSSRSVIPHLLVSIHMALEDFLLRLSEQGETELVKCILKHLLDPHNSLSLIAIVASVVTAHPWKFMDEALILFNTIEYFQLDNLRLMSERQVENLMGIAYLHHQEAGDERLKSFNLPHRKKNLEFLCTYYQYHTTNDKSSITSTEQFRSQIHQILDKHYSEIANTHPADEDIQLILLHRIDRRKHNPIVTPTNNDNEYLIEFRPQMPAHLQEVSNQSMDEYSQVMRFSMLYTWAGCKFRNEDVSLFKDYEDNPHLIVMLIKDLEKAIVDGEPLMPMDENGRYSAAGMLLAKCSKKLPQDDVDYCISIVEERLDSAIAGPYYAQIGDGLEECVHALPAIMELKPEKEEKVWGYIKDILKCKERLGEYKKVCDYAIECCHLNNFWNRFEDKMIVIAQSLSRKSLDFVDITILLDWVTPGASHSQVTTMIMEKVMPMICETLKINLRGDYSHFYHYHDLYGALAKFLLSLSSESRTDFVQCLVNNINSPTANPTRISADNWGCLLNQLILTNYKQHKSEEMIEIWNALYEPLRNSRLLERHSVMKEYLLAPDYLFRDMKEWEGLRETDLWIYKKLANEYPHNSQVFNGIIKIADSIGSRWTKQLLTEMHFMIMTCPDMNLHENENETIFLMERVLGSYINKHRKEIQRDRMKKEMLSDLLTFMANRGSVNGYHLRDRIW